MKKFYSKSLRGLLTAALALLTLSAQAETVLCSYQNGTMANISKSGTTAEADAKYQLNKTTVKCLQLKNGYMTDGVYNNNAINLEYADGFKAGDLLTIQGFINNKDASKRAAVKLITLGVDNQVVELKLFTDFINGYSTAGEPEKMTFTLTEDAANLKIVRDGNTAANLMFISVVRDPGTGGGDEPTPTPESDHSVKMNALNNQILLRTASGDVKYYNTSDLSEVNIDKVTGTVSVSPKAADWVDEYKQNVTAINFAKAPETGSEGEIVNHGVNITEAKGWLESAYVKWEPFEGATSYRVYIKGGRYDDYTLIDRELVRNYGTYGRADMVGIRAGVYSMKVVPVIGGVEDESKASEAKEMTVKPHDRSGFAFHNFSGVGAYNDNGELKENADVIYVTAETAKTVKCTIFFDKTETEFVGLQAIMAALEKGTAKRPIAVRIIGTIRKDDMDALLSDEGLQVKGKNNTIPMNVTIEGIGDDATVWGFGMLLRNAYSVELRNFGNMICMDDCVSLDTKNNHCWIHHIDFFYGGTGKDKDQAKGDGSIDVKGNSQYITIAYNRFHDSGKTSLCGLKESGPNYIDYHHNWFDHSDSRHPRVRTMSVHVWNNYYDGVAKYGAGASLNSSVFVENNYFRGSKNPMLINGMGTDAKGNGTFDDPTGGLVKSYGNVYVEKGTSGNYTPITQHVAAADFDCYEVSSRDEKVPSTVVSTKGGSNYDNFDTDPALMHSYTPLDAVDVPAVVTGYYGAGRLNKGDFIWDFNYPKADEDYSVISELKEALLNYKTTLVGIFE